MEILLNVASVKRSGWTRSCICTLFVACALTVLVPDTTLAEKALVIDGDKSRGGVWAGNTDNKAVKRLKKAGHDVSEVEAESTKDVNDAMTDDIEIVVFIGHGSTDNDGNSVEGVNCRDEYKNRINSATFCGRRFPKVKQVFLISCSQLPHPSWRWLFPNAVIYGFSDDITWFTGWYWAKELPVIEASNPSITGPDDVVLNYFHESLHPIPRLVDTNGVLVANMGSPMNPLHTLDPNLAADFGHQRYNLWVNGEIMVGIEVNGGQVSDYNEIYGYKSPNFEVFIDHNDFIECLGYPPTLNKAFLEGRVIVSDVNTGLSAETLYLAVAGTFFGIDNSCNFDFTGDGSLKFDDYAILAHHWLETCSGSSSPNDCNAVDIAPLPAGDGVVDINDFLLFKDNWLAEVVCPPYTR